MENGIRLETASNSELRFLLKSVKGGNPEVTPVLYGTHVYVFKYHSNNHFLITVLHQKLADLFL